jgi:membrane protein implicated in regulation of membrane protease activity
MLSLLLVAVLQQIPEGFSPVAGGPQIEQIAAAPLVVASYAFFLLLMVFYLWTIWRRIGKVETEMHALERRQAEKR